MGIDFDKTVNDRFKEVMNDDAVNYLIKDLEF
jgi:hypothetical protein